MAAKYVFVTGGVVSGLGKGITAASLGRLLKCQGSAYRLKAGSIPQYRSGHNESIQHGGVFVTDDGAETDLDLGHYDALLTSA